jgi:sec-independent protein translocase protein TatA
MALLGPLGWPELIILAILGVLIFGKRLPEVGKSLGKGIVEFKKGLAGIEDDVNQATTRDAPNRIEDRESTTIDTGVPNSETTSAGETGQKST